VPFQFPFQRRNVPEEFRVIGAERWADRVMAGRDDDEVM
jgi:hypothetical protein